MIPTHRISWLIGTLEPTEITFFDASSKGTYSASRPRDIKSCPFHRESPQSWQELASRPPTPKPTVFLLCLTWPSAPQWARRLSRWEPGPVSSFCSTPDSSSPLADWSLQSSKFSTVIEFLFRMTECTPITSHIQRWLRIARGQRELLLSRSTQGEVVRLSSTLFRVLHWILRGLGRSF